MLRFVVLSVVIAQIVLAVQGQQYRQDSRTAAIISEQRYQSGDGKFGAAYTQEDGIDFKEETDSDGTRRGKYSYVDPSGQLRTVEYTAGKNGFQAHGDHLPQAPPAPAHAIEQLNQQPQYHDSKNYDVGNANDYDDGSYDPRYNEPSFNGRSGDIVHHANPAPAPVPQFHQQQQQQQQQQLPQPSFVATHHHEQYNQHNNQGAPAQFTTPAPHRFQPPGKLSLSRTPDGFSYTFNKV